MLESAKVFLLQPHLHVRTTLTEYWEKTRQIPVSVGNNSVIMGGIKPPSFSVNATTLWSQKRMI